MSWYGQSLWGSHLVAPRRMQFLSFILHGVSLLSHSAQCSTQYCVFTFGGCALISLRSQFTTDTFIWAAGQNQNKSRLTAVNALCSIFLNYIFGGSLMYVWYTVCGPDFGPVYSVCLVLLYLNLRQYDFAVELERTSHCCITVPLAWESYQCMRWLICISPGKKLHSINHSYIRYVSAPLSDFQRR